MSSAGINDEQDNMSLLIIEIMLEVNNRLYIKGYITEEMYRRAKEEILKSA